MRTFRLAASIPLIVATLTAALMLAFSCAANASTLTVSPDGVLVKGGKPYRAIGANVEDAFFRLWEHQGDYSYDRDFATLEAEGIPFARISATYFTPDAMLQYVEHRDDYLTKLDGVVNSAAAHHIGLVMVLFWDTAAIPDLMHEPRSQWGNPDSKTIAFMREYTRTIVSRYKDSPAVWVWEFGEEYNLNADLPNAAQSRPEIIQNFHWPERRTAADDLSTPMLLVAFTEFAKAVRDYDADRPISTGNCLPREQAEHLLRSTRTWEGSDTRAQMRANLIRTNPDPVDTISIHMFPNMLRNRFGKPLVSYNDILAEAMKVSRAERKPIIFGEFGSALGQNGLTNETQVKGDFDARLRAIIDNRVPLSAVWNISSSYNYRADVWTVSRERGLGWMLDSIKTANDQIAAELVSEQRVADLLPQFEGALQAADRNAVRAFQELLIERGFKPGSADGKYGSATKQALTACVAEGKCSVADVPAEKPSSVRP